MRSPTLQRSSLAIVAFVLAVAPGAKAQTDNAPPSDAPPKKARIVSIVRGTGAGSDKAAGFVGHFMRDTLEADPRYEVVSIGAALGSNDDPDQVLTRAGNLAFQGREAYDSLDLDQAVEHLNGALRELERSAFAVRDIKRVSEILMLLGATHILRGEDAKGRDRLAQALTLDSTVEPDPTIFNPSMRTIFKSAQAAVNKARRGSIAITSSPSYSEVFVDGKFVGIAPTTVDSTIEGRHYVRVIRDGYREFGTVIAVKGNAEVSQVAELAPAPKLDEYEHLVNLTVDARSDAMQKTSRKASEDLLTLASQLGVLLGVEQVFLTDVRLDGERVLLRTTQFDLTTDEKMKSASHAFTYDANAASYQREIKQMMDKHFGPKTLTESTDGATFYGSWDGGLGLKHAGSNVCMGDSCAHFKRNVLLFGGVTTGVMLVGGGVFELLAKKNHNTFRDSPQGSPEAASAASSGKTQNIVGNVMLGVGVVAAVATTYLYFFYHPAPSPEEVALPQRASLVPRLDIAPSVNGGYMVGTWSF